MARTHEELMASLPQERQDKIKARTAEILAEVDRFEAEERAKAEAAEDRSEDPA